MKRYEMVKSHEDFNIIINNGKKISNKYFKVFITKSDNYNSKFGIAVGKKIGNAVIRNKFKRQIRNIVDNNRFLFQNFHNYIIMISRDALGISYQTLEKEFINLFRKDVHEK